MIRHIKAALTATALFGASQANAASFLTVDISAVGSGTSFKNVGTTVETYAFTKFSASLSYYLDGPFAPRIEGDSLAVRGSNSVPSVSGRFSGDGFSFSAISPDPRSGYSIVGNSCFANSNPTTVTVGTPTVNPTCGTIDVFNNASPLSAYRFSGTVTAISFRIVEAAGLPAVAAVIPEPTTWALMLAGFGMVGYAMRRRARVAYA